MLFMIIEHFGANESAIRERFQTKGRMMPDGVAYHASWIDPRTSRCFQVMEAPDARLIDEWISHWSDLVKFEVIPVQTSTDYWAGRR
jgi:Protein of unknown function (DUF3303)